MNMPDLHPKARCEALIVALRAEMPPRFTWDFTIVRKEHECGTAGCALGLAYTLDLIPMPLLHDGDHKLWGMNDEEYADTFYSSEHYPVSMMLNVTPLMVADRVERLLAKGRAGKEPDDCAEI